MAHIHVQCILDRNPMLDVLIFVWRKDMDRVHTALRAIPI